MVFDWFKRKFVKKEDAAPGEPSESAPESSMEESPASPPLEDSAANQVQPDYLAWAREFTYLQTQGKSPTPAEEAPSQVPEVSPELPVETPPAETPIVEPQPVASYEMAVQPVEEVQPIGKVEEVKKIQQPEIQPAETGQVAQPASTPPDIGAGYIEWIRYWEQNSPPAEPSAPVRPAVPEPIEPSESSVVEAVESSVMETTQPAPLVETPPPLEVSPIAEPVQPIQEPTPVAEITAPVETLPVVEVEATPLSSPEPSPAQETVEEKTEEEVPFWRKAFNWNRGASPSSAPTESISAPELIPQEAFDEGFLWSAEVLRAQGRRPEDVTVEEITWLKKLRKGLQRTSRGLVNDLKAVVGKGPISADDLDDIENLLLSADVGVASTERIIEALKVRVKKESLSAEAVFDFLKAQLKEQLEFDDAVGFAPKRGQLNVWLIVGVNGVGKTTTIGKIAHLSQQSGYKTLVAAGDTFRAAAVEQLQEWGRRSEVEVIANQGKNADPAAVVFDGITAAQARGSELLLVDTAGRLQNKKNLMEELAKIRRIIDKKATGAHIEALLVLDASTGQNGLVQAKVFSEVASLSGVILTKLDGTARGGVALAVVEELKIPIRFIGVGEKINDLRPFNSYEFVEALLSDQG
jgi:fused signal recognition particle receptor